MNAFGTMAMGMLLCLPTRAAAVGLAPAQRWDEERAAHLLRRAGFGGTPEEVKSLAAMGMEAAVDSLIDYERIPQPLTDFEPVRWPDRRHMRWRLAGLEAEERQEVNQRLRRLDRLQIEELRAWWMCRMVRTPRPLEERMTLFWHGHFTSGQREVRDSTMMYEQNAVLRASALGNYRDLLVRISQDPAMLRYLDNASNRKQAPNENFARELMELFTLGEGNYSEQDVKEGARALTGWTLKGDEFVEARRWHDGGVKSFLGRTGDFDGYDIIDIILEQPQAARHLAKQILDYFVCEDPPPSLVDSLAAVIRGNGYDLRESMRTLFKSEAFYSPQFLHCCIKGPVELVAGSFRLLEIEPSDPVALVGAARGMGQELFQPPNVEGWDGGREWVNTATTYSRYNFASGMLTGTQSRPAARLIGAGPASGVMRNAEVHRGEVRDHAADYPGLVVPDAQVEFGALPRFDPTNIIEQYRLYTADRVVNHFVNRVLQMQVSPRQRAWLKDLLTGGDKKFDPRREAGKMRVVSLINALMAMPEYQLN